MQIVLPAPQTTTTRQVLHSWKDIANYTGRGIRTLQRYEVGLGFPIHRVAGKPRSAVLAFSDEIDAWLSKAPTASTTAEAVSRPVTAAQATERMEWSMEWTAVAAKAKRSQETAQATYEACRLQAQRVQEMMERIKAIRLRVRNRRIVLREAASSSA